MTDIYDEGIEGRQRSTSPVSKNTDDDDPYAEKYPTNDKFEKFTTDYHSNEKFTKYEPPV